MITVTQLIGQRAVSLTDAQEKGQVGALRFEGDRVVELEVGGRRIPASAVHSFSGDVLTFDDEEGIFADEVRQPTEPEAPGDLDPDHESIGLRETGSDEAPTPNEDDDAVPLEPAPWIGTPIGKELLTDAGDSLGKVSDMELDDDGHVRLITDDTGVHHDGAALRAVGSYAVVVREALADS